MAKTKKEIDDFYLAQANALEAEFFQIVDEGTPNQHRVLRAGKTIEDFNVQHATIWQNHEAELTTEGYIKPIPIEEQPIDWQAKFNELQSRIEALESKEIS